MKKEKKSNITKRVNMEKIERQKELALDFMKREKESPVFIWIFQIVIVLALAAVTAIFFFQSISLQEGSMEPTFRTGEKFFINKVLYSFKEPKRGDVIAFTKDGKDHAVIHVKRIIGMPSETVQIKDGKIYIDGEVYKEEKKFPEITNAGLADEPVKLKKDEYFVLGDNRNNSEDSRFAEVKNVKKKYIEGKVWFRIKPLKKMGFMKH